MQQNSWIHTFGSDRDGLASENGKKQTNQKKAQQINTKIISSGFGGTFTQVVLENYGKSAFGFLKIDWNFFKECFME